MLVAGVPLVVATAASASRAPTADELAQIARDTGETAACLTVRITTAKDADAGYARVERTEPAPAGCSAANAFTVLTTAGAEPGFWLELLSTNDDGKGPCSENEIPAGVGRDLDVCDPPVPPSRTQLTCWRYSKAGKGRQITARRPSSCLTLAPDDSFADAADLRKLRWRGWGKSVARATGRAYSFHPGQGGPKWVRATVTASRPVEVNGQRFYRRLTVKTRYGTGRPITLPTP
jgi:hypothetical protein